MALIDWIVLVGTIAGIIIYGIWKTRNVNTTQSYLQGDHDLKWWSIGLSIMATQASAITFLSTPGQAYEDGMGFAQFYFGLPLAMVILSVFVFLSSILYFSHFPFPWYVIIKLTFPGSVYNINFI